MISVITLTDKFFKVSLQCRFFPSVPPQLIKRGNCPNRNCYANSLLVLLYASLLRLFAQENDGM